jgi:hypothetical protein
VLHKRGVRILLLALLQTQRRIDLEEHFAKGKTLAKGGPSLQSALCFPSRVLTDPQSPGRFVDKKDL